MFRSVRLFVEKWKEDHVARDVDEKVDLDAEREIASDVDRSDTVGQHDEELSLWTKKKKKKKTRSRQAKFL